MTTILCVSIPAMVCLQLLHICQSTLEGNGAMIVNHMAEKELLRSQCLEMAKIVLALTSPLPISLSDS